LTSAEGFQKVLSQLLGNEGIPTVTTPTALQAVQRGAGANMSVDVSLGSALISNTTNTFGYAAWQDAVSNVAITAANASNPRIDAVVAYINLAAVSTTNNNNPGSLVFTAIAGTPAGSPSAPTNSTIQATLGASVPWVRLANVTVPANATQIVTANIADARPPLAVYARLWGGASNTNGHIVPNVADDTVVLVSATQTLTGKTLGAGNTVSSGAMALSKTTDANGWERYDYGTFQEYHKQVTFSQAFTAGSAAAVTLNSNNLPVGMSTLGSNFIYYSFISSGFGGDLKVNCEMASSSSTLSFVAKGDVSRTQGGSINVRVITP
jgi:hypothetical protein